MKVKVTEIFHSIQGEGPFTGRNAIFLRLFGCNLWCTWCDSTYSWDIADPRHKYQVMDVNDLIIHLSHLYYDHNKPMLVVTGGEPLIHQMQVDFIAKNYHGIVQIETNGTILPKYEYLISSPNVYYVVSPKLANSKVDERIRLVPSALQFFSKHPRSYFKFVVDAPAELYEVDSIVSRFDIPKEKVYIMPLGVKPDEIIKRQAFLSEYVLKRGYNLSTRLHILLWGNVPGR